MPATAISLNVATILTTIPTAATDAAAWKMRRLTLPPLNSTAIWEMVAMVSGRGNESAILRSLLRGRLEPDRPGRVWEALCQFFRLFDGKPSRQRDQGNQQPRRAAILYRRSHRCDGPNQQSCTQGQLQRAMGLEGRPRSQHKDGYSQKQSAKAAAD